MTRFVLDASTALSWCFEDQKTDYSEDVLSAASGGASPVAPTIWIYEVVNVLALAQRRGGLEEAAAVAFWGKLRGLVTIAEGVDNEAAGRIFSLCRRHRLTAYDAAYLELALREGVPLATGDRSLKKAARAAGIRPFAPSPRS